LSLIFKELLENAALLLAICFIYRFISYKWAESERKRQLFAGLLFGASCIVAMLFALEFKPGIIFDTRTAVLASGALFGGPITAAISAIIATTYRIHLGGVGVEVGVAVILLSILCGLLVRRFCKCDIAELVWYQFLIFGIAVHVLVIACFSLLPVDFVPGILMTIAIPYLVILSAATVALGLLLREVERLRKSDITLRRSHDRLEYLFNNTGIAILDEDYSKTYQILDQLRASGVINLRSHLTEHHEQVSELAASVKIKDVNPASIQLFEVDKEEDLAKSIQTYFGPEAEKSFIEQMCLLWDRADSFKQEATLKTQQGALKHCIISLPLPRSEAEAAHIPVSILDITELRKAESQAAINEQRLRDIIWGTDVGTWDWNIQTGDVIFNERWADIVGYQLKELEPLSIETWGKLSHPDDLEKSEAILKQVFEGQIDFYECEVRMLHKDGHWIWVHDRGKIVERDESGEPLRMSGTHLDITDRKEAEFHADRLLLIRESLLQCHKAILTAKSEKDLFYNISQILVEKRGYALVWFGVPVDDVEKSIQISASYGEHTAYLERIKIHWSDDDLSHGQTGMAVITGKVQVNNNLSANPNFKPWSVSAKDDNLQASAAIPILVNNKVVAVLNVYSSLSDAFEDTELSLLSEFASTISLALRISKSQEQERLLTHKLKEAAFGAVRAIAATIEKRDPYTSGHQDNVATLSVEIAKRLGWDKYRIEGLHLGATIHDIGKIYIPAEILNRPGKLSVHEFGMIKSHPVVGREILASTSFPWPIQDMVGQHHERIDGSGYPDGLKGDKIIDEAKVIAVADVLDAITSHRPYRPGLGVEVALEELERGSGTAYDPTIVDVCIKLVRDEGFRWHREIDHP